jgi:cytochrome d ubiquinol oxidase subunit II
VGAILAGWALAQRPDFLPGELSFQDAAAGDGTLLATLIGLLIGLALILPAMALLFKLTLQGRLDERFKPIAGTREERP